MAWFTRTRLLFLLGWWVYGQTEELGKIRRNTSQLWTKYEGRTSCFDIDR